MLFFRVFRFKNYIFNISVLGRITKFKYGKDYILIWLFNVGVVGRMKILPKFHVERKGKMLAHIPRPIFSKGYFSGSVRGLFLLNIFMNCFWKNHISICKYIQQEETSYRTREIT